MKTWLLRSVFLVTVCLIAAAAGVRTAAVRCFEVPGIGPTEDCTVGGLCTVPDDLWECIQYTCGGGVNCGPNGGVLCSPTGCGGRNSCIGSCPQ